MWVAMTKCSIGKKTNCYKVGCLACNTCKGSRELERERQVSKKAQESRSKRGERNRNNRCEENKREGKTGGETHKENRELAKRAQEANDYETGYDKHQLMHCKNLQKTFVHA